MNYLTKFTTEAAYDAQKGALALPNVSLIAATDEVKYAAKPKHFLDFLHSNGTINNIPADDVIGICVIPESHYGKARFMSVVNMSESSTSGTISNSEIAWDSRYYNQMTTVLPTQYNDIVALPGNYLQAKDFSLNNFSTVGNLWAYMPGDSVRHEDEEFVLDVSGTDLDTIANVYGGYSDISGHYFIISPFKKNGSYNPLYTQFFPESVLSDINGYSNTNTIIKVGNIFPAAQACHDFNPGFESGNWYLPAIGELAYIYTRFNTINDKLSELEDAGCSVALLSSDSLWSSSEQNANDAYTLNIYAGYVDRINKNDPISVRAFLAL